MAEKSALDPIVEYPMKALAIISEDKNCVAFMLNKAVSTINYDDLDRAFLNMHNYSFINETTLEAECHIFCESVVTRIENNQIADWDLVIQIACHKSYMEIKDRKLFPGIVGNRRDNIARSIDLALNNSRDFGIGKLRLKRIDAGSLTTGFTIRELVYSTNDFNVGAYAK